MEPKNLSQEISDIQKTSTPTTSTIRTMKGDVALAIQRQQETLVSIALAEEKKKQAQKEAALRAAQEKMAEESLAPKSRGRMFLVLVFIMIIALGVLGYYVALPRLASFKFSSISENPVPTPATPLIPEVAAPARIVLTPALIPTQAETTFSLKQESPAHIFDAIKSERFASDITWEVKNFIITDETSTLGVTKTTPISFNRLTLLAGTTMPEILTRSLQNTMMIGLLNEKSSSVPTPFIIVKVSNYSTALAGMLQWEGKLPSLFDAVFGTNISAGLNPKTKTRDVVILGHDSRVLEITPNVGAAYTFANESTLVIAGSRTALEKIIPLFVQ